jgi:acyl-CoA thioesterase-1
MARGPAIEKGKEVAKMKRAVRLSIAACLCLALAPLPKVEAETRVPVIVAFGDSLTAGFGVKQAESFPAQLEAALKARGHAVSVVNAGVSGDTAAAGLARVDWSVPDDASGVILELGANDALQGLPPEATKAALASIIEKLQAKGLPVLLAGMEAPRNMGEEYVRQFRAIYTELAARYHLLLYPFFLDGAAMHEDMTQGDGLHPNGKGVAAIVANILPKVEELLAEVAAKGQGSN